MPATKAEGAPGERLRAPGGASAERGGSLLCRVPRMAPCKLWGGGGGGNISARWRQCPLFLLDEERVGGGMGRRGGLHFSP